MTPKEERLKKAHELLARRNRKIIQEPPRFRFSIDILGIIKTLIILATVGYGMFMIITHIDQIVSFILKCLAVFVIGAIAVNSFKQSGSSSNFTKSNYQEECDRKKKENWERMQERTIQSCRNIGSNTQVFTVDGNGRPSGGFCLVGTLYGYTSNTVTVRRGKVLVTYNAYGSSSGPARWTS